MRTRRLAIAATLSLAALASVPAGALAQQAEAMKIARPMWRGFAPACRWAGTIIGCLKEHKIEVSIGCAKALQAMKGKMGK